MRILKLLILKLKLPGAPFILSANGVIFQTFLYKLFKNVLLKRKAKTMKLNNCLKEPL